MSIGGINTPDPTGSTNSYDSRDWLMANAEATRAARMAGHKSPFRCLLDRLRPHRQEPGGDPQGNYGTTDDSPR